ncbi:hypothetical protein ACIHCV_36635 [Streptomyces sp. NPDC051956]|uniref:hypothetical protein n=1 Tax=Streptomyces sp. NPDC051956 TaxID=3365677 RepID=UPI0037D832FB
MITPRRIVIGGLIKRVSPALVHTYFEYVTTEYPRGTGHVMLLVQLHGADTGQPWVHAGQWQEAEVRGMSRAQFLRTAEPLPAT